MMQLHNPRERAAGIDIRADDPVMDVQAVRPFDNPETPRAANARGVRFCAEGGFHV